MDTSIRKIFYRRLNSAFVLGLAFCLSTQTLAAAPATPDTVGMAAAPNVLSPTADMSNTDFMALKVANGNPLSIDELNYSQLVTPELAENLKGAFLRAQQAYLKSESPKTEPLWRDVVSFSLKADWRETHREMMQIAFFRLAQIAATSEKTHYWLSECARFDPFAKPNAAYIPAQLYEQYDQIKAQQNILADVSNDSLDGFTLLVVNGRLYNLESSTRLQLPEGTHRFTLLSPIFNTVTRVMTAEQWVHFQPEKERATWATSAPRYDRPVINRFTGEASIEGTAPRAEKPFYKKTWFWVGAAALTGAVVLYQKSREKDDPRAPTHREGF